MLTREQIEEIRAASLEQGEPIKKILEERGIPASQYFWWKRKYARHDVPEGFLPVVDSGLPAATGAIASPSVSRGKAKASPATESWMSIELRTASGTDMRIQGGLTPAMVYTILKSV